MFEKIEKMFYNVNEVVIMKERIIFHIDVNNAFLSWTAVLLLKNGYKEDIRTIASVIGGDESKRHGIVLAKSPVAKKFGITTAQVLYQAKQKCPNLQIFPANYEWYYQKSNELYNYLSSYTPIIERYSIDECFLDMTGTNYLYDDYLSLAYKIKEDIKKKFGYTVNIGIGNNKLCAKMASDFEKPDRVHTLFKEEIPTKLWPLPVGDLFMCGKKTKQELNRLSIFTIKDLSQADDKVLERNFKSQGRYLKEASLGIDNTPVEQRTSKNQSISISETLPFDLIDEVKIKNVLFRQTEELARQLRKQKLFTDTIAVIFKNKDFISYSAQYKLDNATDNTKEIYETVINIFEKNYKEDALRLIGLRLSGLKKSKEKQISLFEEPSKVEKEDEELIQKTMDSINEKFGKALVAPASLKIIGTSKTKNQYK